MLANWVKETTATSGTGLIALAGAETGFISFGAAFGDGELVYYTIEDGDNRESGLGKFTLSGTTLTRTTVLETLVSGTFDNTAPTAINLSGSAVISCAAQEGMFGIHPVQTSTDYKILSVAGADGSEGGTGGMVADRMYAVPVRIDVAGNYDAVMIEVTTLSAGNIRLGLATVNQDLSIGNYLGESANISTGTTGYKTGTFTSVYLHIGDYYMLYLGDATPSTETRDRRHQGLQNFVGRNNTNSRVYNSMIASTITGAPTFPTTPPTLSESSFCPNLALRRAA